MILPLRSRICLFLMLLLFAPFTGCADSDTQSAGSGAPAGGEANPKVAYVTNGIASFWVIAEKGAMDGGKKFNADVNVQMPANGVEDQKRMCQDLLAQGIDGIAISPIDPDNQGELLAEISQHTKLIISESTIIRPVVCVVLWSRRPCRKEAAS